MARECGDAPRDLRAAPLAAVLLYGLGCGADDPIETVLLAIDDVVISYQCQIQRAGERFEIADSDLESLHRRIRVAIELYRRSRLESSPNPKEVGH